MAIAAAYHRTSPLVRPVEWDLGSALQQLGSPLDYRVGDPITPPVIRRALRLALDQLGVATRTANVAALQREFLHVMHVRGALPAWTATASLATIELTTHHRAGLFYGMKVCHQVLAAFSVVSPPVLLWWRTPTIDWWQPRLVLSLRILQHPETRA